MSHISPIPGGMRAGLVITIKGEVLPGAKRFRVDLQTGKSRDGDIQFHSGIRLDEGVIVRNNRSNDVWHAEDRYGTLNIHQGRAFWIEISVEVDKYVMYIDGKFFCIFPHRMSMSQVTHLSVYGDCLVESVTFKIRESSEQRFVTTTTEYVY
ncbi:galectin-4-like [Sitophilus oryzae]|uniref:Galectin n=1 Tax=Sitophilus oryzae TaxID=7048 RepID=A0A6J2XMQ7_SITOR|nr:galectin-4-like [Sitophilus oryzae]